MKRAVKITTLLVIAAAMIFSCQSNKDERGNGRPGMDRKPPLKEKELRGADQGKAPQQGPGQGGPEQREGRGNANRGPNGQMPPMMQDKNIGLCMKVLALNDCEDEAVALTDAQKEDIKSVLTDWRESLDAEGESENIEYIDKLLEPLTKEQLQFIMTSEPVKRGSAPEGEAPQNGLIRFINMMLGELS